MASVRTNAVVSGGGIGGLRDRNCAGPSRHRSPRLRASSRIPRRGCRHPDRTEWHAHPPRSRGRRMLKDNVAVPDVLSVRDGATGRELTRLPLGTWIAERHGAPYWTAASQRLAFGTSSTRRSRAADHSEAAEPRSYLSKMNLMEFAQSALTARVSERLHPGRSRRVWSGLRPTSSAGRPTQLAPVGKTAFRSVTSASNCRRN